MCGELRVGKLLARIQPGRHRGISAIRVTDKWQETWAPYTNRYEIKRTEQLVESLVQGCATRCAVLTRIILPVAINRMISYRIFPVTPLLSILCDQQMAQVILAKKQKRW